MKEAILSNWNFVRWVRLAIGIAIVVQAVDAKDITFGLIGIALAGMSVFNIGCCGAGNCYTPVKKDVAAVKEIVYEEVINEK